MLIMHRFELDYCNPTPADDRALHKTKSLNDVVA